MLTRKQDPDQVSDLDHGHQMTLVAALLSALLFVLISISDLCERGDSLVWHSALLNRVQRGAEVWVKGWIDGAHLTVEHNTCRSTTMYVLLFPIFC